MEATTTSPASPGNKSDTVEVRPETLLKRTIKEAEDAHRNQEVNFRHALLLNYVPINKTLLGNGVH